MTIYTRSLEGLLGTIAAGPEAYELEVYQYSEQLELELALKCLKMPILEKKFIGHAILASKINQVKSKLDESEYSRG